MGSCQALQLEPATAWNMGPLTSFNHKKQGMLHDVTNNQWGVRSYQISETYENHQEPSRTIKNHSANWWLGHFNHPSPVVSYLGAARNFWRATALSPLSNFRKAFSNMPGWFVRGQGLKYWSSLAKYTVKMPPAGILSLVKLDPLDPLKRRGPVRPVQYITVQYESSVSLPAEVASVYTLFSICASNRNIMNM